MPSLCTAFIEEVNRALSPEQIAEVNRLNLDGDPEDGCATHLFCDPEELLCRAFYRVRGREPDLESDRDMALMNLAWCYAIGRKFKLR